MPISLKRPPMILVVEIDVGPIANPQTTAATRATKVAAVTTATRRLVGGLVLSTI
jgi:hypothetical protein